MAAGLDGIKKKLDPGNPVNEDIYHLTPEKKKAFGVKNLPTSLFESLEALQSDSSFLDGIFSKDMVDMIIELGTANAKAVAARPVPYEYYLYFDI